jgi:hypothetical protein
LTILYCGAGRAFVPGSHARPLETALTTPVISAARQPVEHLGALAARGSRLEFQPKEEGAPAFCGRPRALLKNDQLLLINCRA